MVLTARVGQQLELGFVVELPVQIEQALADLVLAERRGTPVRLS
jgi:hypothetical protein